MRFVMVMCCYAVFLANVAVVYAAYIGLWPFWFFLPVSLTAFGAVVGQAKKDWALFG